MGYKNLCGIHYCWSNIKIPHRLLVLQKGYANLICENEVNLILGPHIWESLPQNIYIYTQNKRNNPKRFIQIQNMIETIDLFKSKT